jgi:hypothetical protein
MVPKTCTIAQCENKHFSRGMCQKHYSRVRRNGTTETIPMDPMSIFLRYTEKADGCWRWTGYQTPEGRGVINFSSGKVFAYRLAYELLVGPIPEGLTIDHLCVNPNCVNPAHLEPVTLGENSLRGSGPAAQNKRKTHCHKGHPLSGDNLYNKPGGRRQCRRCINERARLRRAAKKGQS